MLMHNAILLVEKKKKKKKLFITTSKEIIEVSPAKRGILVKLLKL
jgi:hypothetical protein